MFAVTSIVPVLVAVTEMIAIPSGPVVSLVSTPQPESVTSAPSTGEPSLVAVKITSVWVSTITLTGSAVTDRVGNLPNTLFAPQGVPPLTELAPQPPVAFRSAV